MVAMIDVRPVEVINFGRIYQIRLRYLNLVMSKKLSPEIW